MRCIIARLIIALGLGLVGLGKRLDPKPAQPSKLVTLRRRDYRRLPYQPSRGEVYRLGFKILFNSVAFATLGV